MSKEKRQGFQVVASKTLCVASSTYRNVFGEYMSVSAVDGECEGEPLLCISSKLVVLQEYPISLLGLYPQLFWLPGEIVFVF